MTDMVIALTGGTVGGLGIAFFVLHRRTIQFRDVFGFISDRTYAREESQKRIDEILQLYARRFLRWCNQERELLKKKANSGILDEGDASTLRTIRQGIKESKDAFWHAHRIARKHGFSVKKFVQEYNS